MKISGIVVTNYSIQQINTIKSNIDAMKARAKRVSVMEAASGFKFRTIGVANAPGFEGESGGQGMPYDVINVTTTGSDGKPVTVQKIVYTYPAGQVFTGNADRISYVYQTWNDAAWLHAHAADVVIDGKHMMALLPADTQDKKFNVHTTSTYRGQYTGMTTIGQIMQFASIAGLVLGAGAFLTQVAQVGLQAAATNAVTSTFNSISNFVQHPIDTISRVYDSATDSVSHFMNTTPATSAGGADTSIVTGSTGTVTPQFTPTAEFTPLPPQTQIDQIIANGTIVTPAPYTPIPAGSLPAIDDFMPPVSVPLDQTIAQNVASLPPVSTPTVTAPTPAPAGSGVTAASVASGVKSTAGTISAVVGTVKAVEGLTNPPKTVKPQIVGVTGNPGNSGIDVKSLAVPGLIVLAALALSKG